MANKYLDLNGLLYVWQKITTKFVAKEVGKGLSTNDYTTTEKDKLNAIPGIKQVGSGLTLSEQGVLSAEVDEINWEGIQNKPTTVSGYGITDVYNKTEVDSKLGAVYKPAGNCLFANLPTPSASNLGNVYSMLDAFTTDDRFIASEPTQYPIGTNVAVVQVMVEDAPTYLFDVLAGFVDLSGYMKTTDMVAITNSEIDEIVGAA